MTRDLLAGSSLASQLEDVLSDELVAAVRLSPFGPLSATHGRVCFEGYSTIRPEVVVISQLCTYPAGKHLPTHQTRLVHHLCLYPVEVGPGIPSTFGT